MFVRKRSSRASTGIRVTRGRAGFQARVTSRYRSSLQAPARPFLQIRSELDSAILPRSWPTATRAPAPRSRRWRCAWRDTARATTQARGTSGRATTTCHSKKADEADTSRCSDGVVSDTRPCPWSTCLGWSADSLGSVDERVAELATECVPRFDSLPRLCEQSLGLDRQFVFLG